MNSRKTQALYRWTADDCSYQYPDNSSFHLDLASCLIEFERVLGVYGLSGSGKSTFGKLLGQVLTPTSGSLEGRRVVAGQPEQRVAFKYLPQQPEEFLLGMRLDELVRRFLPAANALEFRRLLDYFELPLAGIYQRLGYELSAGQLRKVALAFGWSYPCDGIILDEPTLGLSPRTRRQFVQLIRENQSSKAIVLISHDFLLLESLSERILVFEEGRLTFAGTMTQLQAATALVQRVGIDQFRLLLNSQPMIRGKVYESY